MLLKEIISIPVEYTKSPNKRCDNSNNKILLWHSTATIFPHPIKSYYILYTRHLFSSFHSFSSATVPEVYLNVQLIGWKYDIET